MADNDGVATALAEIHQRPYYAISLTFEDNELMAAMHAALEMGIHPPDIPTPMTVKAVYDHGDYWARIITIAQVMYR